LQILNLPYYQFKITSVGGKQLIFDVFRSKYVSLTPEEWVRQNFLTWLHQDKGYPAGLIAVESSTKYNNLAKRADAIIFANDGKPKMVIECKATDVKITQDAFDQAARYNVSIKANYIAISNGMEHYCCKSNSESEWVFLDDFPDFGDL